MTWLDLTCDLQKTAVAVAHVKRGNGLVKLNGESSFSLGLMTCIFDSILQSIDLQCNMSWEAFIESIRSTRIYCDWHCRISIGFGPARDTPVQGSRTHPPAWACKVFQCRHQNQSEGRWPCVPSVWYALSHPTVFGLWKARSKILAVWLVPTCQAQACVYSYRDLQLIMAIGPTLIFVFDRFSTKLLQAILVIATFHRAAMLLGLQKFTISFAITPPASYDHVLGMCVSDHVLRMCASEFLKLTARNCACSHQTSHCKRLGRILPKM